MGNNVLCGEETISRVFKDLESMLILKVALSHAFLVAQTHSILNMAQIEMISD